jgi:hypothetical protein
LLRALTPGLDRAHERLRGSQLGRQALDTEERDCHRCLLQTALLQAELPAFSPSFPSDFINDTDCIGMVVRVRQALDRRIE